jgi:arylsulfatase A-like enzyme
VRPAPARPSRRRLRFLLAVPALLAACAGEAPPGAPNVLLISLDTCRADHLSAYGYPRETSPFLKELAGSGVLFRRAYVNTHGTPSSHATLLTGLYQETHRVFYEGTRSPSVPRQAVMLQELLRARGYRTLAVADGGYVSAAEGFDRGFDDFFSKRVLIRQGIDRFLERVKASAGARKPLFAFFHTYQIHSPYNPPPEYKERFGPYTSAYSGNHRELFRHADKTDGRLKPEDLELLKGLYDAEIAFTDDQLRRLFAGLERLGFLRDALVVIVSDHGEEFGEHGGLVHGGKMFEELLHVPLIMTGRRVPRGKTVDALVGLVDVAPTVLSYLGVPVPASMSGQDVLDPAIERLDRAVVSQFGGRIYAVLRGPWKLIEYTSPPRSELFHLTKDPLERADAASAHPDVVRELRDVLRTWRRTQTPLSEPSSEPVAPSPEKLEELKVLGYVR